MLSGTSKQRASRHPPPPSVCDTAAAATIPAAAAAADDDDAPLTGGGGGKERRSSRHQPPPSTSDTAATTSATATAAAAPHSSDGGSVHVSASYRKKRSPWSFHEEEQVPTTSTGLTTHWPTLQLSITLTFCTRVLNRSLHQTPKSGFNPQRRLTLVSIKVKSKV